MFYYAKLCHGMDLNIFLCKKVVPYIENIARKIFTQNFEAKKCFKDSLTLDISDESGSGSFLDIRLDSNAPG